MVLGAVKFLHFGLPPYKIGVTWPAAVLQIYQRNIFILLPHKIVGHRIIFGVNQI